MDIISVTARRQIAHQAQKESECLKMLTGMPVYDPSLKANTFMWGSVPSVAKQHTTLVAVDLDKCAVSQLGDRYLVI